MKAKPTQIEIELSRKELSQLKSQTKSIKRPNFDPEKLLGYFDVDYAQNWAKLLITRKNLLLLRKTLTNILATRNFEETTKTNFWEQFSEFINQIKL